MTATKRPSGYSEILDPTEEQIAALLADKESGELARVILDRTTRGRVRAVWFRRAVKKKVEATDTIFQVTGLQPESFSMRGCWEYGLGRKDPETKSSGGDALPEPVSLPSVFPAGPDLHEIEIEMAVERMMAGFPSEAREKAQHIHLVLGSSDPAVRRVPRPATPRQAAGSYQETADRIPANRRPNARDIICASIIAFVGTIIFHGLWK